MEEDWKLCVDWLVRCNVLSSDHKLARNDAQVFDLAQFIRDGVVLCHLLNHLSPGCINPKNFSQRPQMSQVCQLAGGTKYRRLPKQFFSSFGSL